mgnify:CR=1 FL=1
MSEPSKPAHEIDVRYVAHLARMHLTDQEVAELSGQIGDIVGYFHQLDALDVSGIEPMAHTTPVDNVLRADEPAPGLDRADVLANAPAKRNNLILVPKILE